jgi:hypothetical protein
VIRVPAEAIAVANRVRGASIAPAYVECEVGRRWNDQRPTTVQGNDPTRWVEEPADAPAASP